MKLAQKQSAKFLLQDIMGLRKLGTFWGPIQYMYFSR